MRPRAYSRGEVWWTLLAMPFRRDGVPLPHFALRRALMTVERSEDDLARVVDEIERNDHPAVRDRQGKR